MSVGQVGGGQQMECRAMLVLVSEMLEMLNAAPIARSRMQFETPTQIQALGNQVLAVSRTALPSLAFGQCEASRLNISS